LHNPKLYIPFPGNTFVNGASNHNRDIRMATNETDNCWSGRRILSDCITSWEHHTKSGMWSGNSFHVEFFI